MEKTPSKEGVDDASYLYSEESLLDYLKLFKFNSEKDYAPLLITAGFDCVARLAGEAKDYVGLGIPLGHALDIERSTKVIQADLRGSSAPSHVAAPPPPSSYAIPASTTSTERRVAAGEPPAFPTCAKGRFPGRVAFKSWLVRLVAWVARWSEQCPY